MAVEVASNPSPNLLLRPSGSPGRTIKRQQTVSCCPLCLNRLQPYNGCDITLERVTISTEQLHVCSTHLCSIETGTSRCCHSVVPVTARIETIEFKAVGCAACSAAITEHQFHSCPGGLRPEFVSSCHRFLSILATRLQCEDLPHSDLFARTAPQCACSAESSVESVSLAQSSQQFANASISFSVFKWCETVKLASRMLAAIRD